MDGQHHPCFSLPLSVFVLEADGNHSSSQHIIMGTFFLQLRSISFHSHSLPGRPSKCLIVDGDVLVDGEIADMSALVPVIGFVSEEASVPASSLLTVQEYLWLMAHMR